MVEAQYPIEEPSSTRSVGKTTTAGIILSLLQGLFGRVLGLISQLVLAKILLPEDFGILGLATTISAFFTVLTNFGIDQVLQQRQRRMHLWATQAFWISLTLATIAAIAMSVYAPIGAHLYHNDKIIPLVWIMALGLPLSALSVVPEARLKTSLKFKFMLGYGSVEMIVTQVLMILMAWRGWGAISFVLPGALMAAIYAVVYWRVAPVPLRPVRVSRGWKKMMARGSAAFGISLLIISIGQGDYITLGLIAPASVVGVYFFAFRLASQPLRMLASSFVWALRPALITMSHEPERQMNAVLKTATLLGLLTVPICFLQAAVARPGLTLLFGTRWAAAIPLIQILSISLPLDAVSWTPGALLDARGQFGRSLKYQLISAPFFFILVGAGVLLGSSTIGAATGVAIGVTLYYTIHPIVFTTLVFSREGVGIRRILSCFFIPFLFGSVTFGGAYAVSKAPPFQHSLIAQIAVTAFLGPSTYLLAIRQFSPAMYRDVRSKVLELVKRKRAR